MGDKYFVGNATHQNSSNYPHYSHTHAYFHCYFPLPSYVGIVFSLSLFCHKMPTFVITLAPTIQRYVSKSLTLTSPILLLQIKQPITRPTLTLFPSLLIVCESYHQFPPPALLSATVPFNVPYPITSPHLPLLIGHRNIVLASFSSLCASRKTYCQYTPSENIIFPFGDLFAYPNINTPF